MTRDEYAENVKSAFISIGTKGIYTALVSSMPFFKLPIIGAIAEFLIRKTVSTLVNLTEMQMFFIYIDMRTADQAKDFELAAINNRKAQESGTEEEKKIAEKNLINSFRVFAKLSS